MNTELKFLGRRHLMLPILFLTVFSITCFLRLWQLGSIPPGVSNDEASYIYSSYSIWKTGRDIQGKWLPISFQTDNSLSPVPIYLNAPIVGLLGMTPLTGRLLYALAGIGSVVLLALITQRLFENTRLSLFVMAVYAVSPWQSYVSRTAYESGLALFFILLGVYVFLRGLHKGGFVWSVIPFFLGFYSYHATKIFLVLFIPLLLIVYRRHIASRKRELVLFIAGCLVTVLSFLYIIKTQSVTRQDLFLWNYGSTASKMVNWEREKNTAPFFLRQVFNNKILYYGRMIRENYLEAFSPQYLFLYGEPGGLSGLYGVLSHGVLYLIDLPLLLFGMVQLVTRKKYGSQAWLIFGGLVLAPLGSALTIDKSYVMRAITMTPFLAIIAGYGLFYVLTQIRTWSRRFFLPLCMGIMVLYGFFVLSYFYQYFFRFAIYDAESWFTSSRDVVRYVLAHKNEYDRVLIVNPGDLLIQYAFYDNLNPDITRRQYTKESPKQMGNVSLIGGCYDPKVGAFVPLQAYPKRTLYIVPEKCHKETPATEVIRQIGEPLRIIWKIYSIR